MATSGAGNPIGLQSAAPNGGTRLRRAAGRRPVTILHTAFGIPTVVAALALFTGALASALPPLDGGGGTKKAKRERPPPIVNKVEVIEEVVEARYLTELTEDQLRQLKSEEARWRREAEEEGAASGASGSSMSAEDDHEEEMLEEDSKILTAGLGRWVRSMNSSRAAVRSAQERLRASYDPWEGVREELLSYLVDCLKWSDSMKALSDGARVVMAERVSSARTDVVAELRYLSGKSTFADLSGSDLDRTFGFAMAQVEDLAGTPPLYDDAAGWQWDATADLGAVVKSAELDGIGADVNPDECDTAFLLRSDFPSLEAINIDEEDDEDGVARASDLYAYAEEIQITLENRTKRYAYLMGKTTNEKEEIASPLSTNNGEDRVSAEIENMAIAANLIIDQLLKVARDDAELIAGREKTCAGRDDIEELVSGGLEALLRHKDLHDELEELAYSMYIQEDGSNPEIAPLESLPQTEGFSYDAASSRADGGGGSDLTNSVRNLADSPLLPRLMEGLDTLTDAAAGHVYALDSIIDALSGDEYSGGSVGKTVGGMLKDGLRRVKVPKELEEMKAKAGILVGQV